MQALVKKLDIYTHSRSLLNIDLSLLLMMTRNIGTFEENGLAIVEIVFSLLEKENESDFFATFGLIAITPISVYLYIRSFARACLRKRVAPNELCP